MNYSNMLLDDLIKMFIKNKDINSYNEITKRLKYCGFNSDMIENIIGYESNILNYGKNREKLICNYYYIINNKESNILFDNKNEYIYKLDDNITSKTLLLSEILTIIDEAIILTYGSDLSEYKSSKEIVDISKENSNNWLFKEYYTRLENICRFSVSSKDTKNIQFEKEIDILYDNEMQIIMNNRWTDLAIKNDSFKPYSNQYFETMKGEN